MSWWFVQLQSLEMIIKSGPTQALTPYGATIFRVKSPLICPSTYNTLIARPVFQGVHPTTLMRLQSHPIFLSGPAQAAATLCRSDGITTLEMDC